MEDGRKVPYALQIVEVKIGDSEQKPTQWYANGKLRGLLSSPRLEISTRYTAAQV